MRKDGVYGEAIVCGGCESRHVSFVNQIYKNFPYEGNAVKLQYDFYMRQCENCGKIVVDKFDLQLLNSLLKKQIDDYFKQQR